MDDARLLAARDAAIETEREIRQHLRETSGQASEQARGAVAYRHAVALRKSFEDWIATRTYKAAQEQET